MTQHYFAKTGEYGLRETLTDDTQWDMIIPTWHWSEPMWNLMESTTTSKRYDLATHFSINVHRVFSGKCQVCKLSNGELEGQWIVGDKPTNEEERIWPSDLEEPSEILYDA